MLRLALVFFLIAVGSALLGLAGQGGTVESVSRIVFYTFTLLAVLALMIGLLRGPRRSNAA